jgi:predicted  nucleic acid-binding Zn-ribbon protein
MHPDIQTALHLQEIDLRAMELRKEIESLPRQTAVIEKQLEGHIKQLEIERATLAANHRERKQLEANVQERQQKATKLRDQMMQAKTNEQYRAFQHEIAFFDGEVRRFEDRILDLMGESEPLEANVLAAEKALAIEKTSVEQQKKTAQEATTRDRKELAVLLAERAQVAARLPAALLTHYDHQRARSRSGTAVSEARDGLCTFCQMSVRPQVYQDLKQGDSIQYCGNCKNILYYLAPQNLESAIDELPSPQV